jgi:hypothetical protein
MCALATSLTFIHPKDALEKVCAPAFNTGKKIATCFKERILSNKELATLLFFVNKVTTINIWVSLLQNSIFN